MGLSTIARIKKIVLILNNQDNPGSDFWMVIIPMRLLATETNENEIHTHFPG